MHKPPQPFPPAWACDWGEDRRGVWLAFRYQGVRQALRWIAPGEFLMGSPKSEAKREDDEIQHLVSISQGFWLAETTCTQALWQAVTGENPSHFKGEQRPVEQVSWEDVQTFLNQLNKALPGLALRLPTEAEWEYACRAGTQTPFHTGDNLTTEQANYNSDAPYADNPKGIYREGTLDVKSFEPNAWGLYQMHGNVWEWCQDWFGDYPQQAVSDPKGPDTGDSRVSRGGSWTDLARRLRSAYRIWFTPVNQFPFIGFRFARGQELQVQEQAAEPREKTGTAKG